MQDRVDDPPVVRCPGCNQPMEAKERTPVKEGLVDSPADYGSGCDFDLERTIERHVICAICQSRFKRATI
jgi:uncharacterized protein with PIN domain